MNGVEVLRDAFDRIDELVDGALDDLSDDELTFRLDAEANTIAWLVWHLTRVQDDHVAGIASAQQVWISGGWMERFALPFRADATGYAQSVEDVGAVRAGRELLLGYYAAVATRTRQVVDGLTDTDLDRIVDERFDPPVTLGARLVSVIGDDQQHAAQAALIRGVVLRRRVAH